MELDPRLEVIQKMRNQEATSHYQLHQALQGTSYNNGYHPVDRKAYGLQMEEERGESYGFSSFKIRLMLAVLIGLFLFSARTSDKVNFVTEIVTHMEENKTIEEATDQIEDLLPFCN